MIIKKIKLENYTVFEDQQIEFGPGINVIIGENGNFYSFRRDGTELETETEWFE